MKIATITLEEKKQIVKNPKTSQNILRYWSTCSEDTIRIYVAANPNTPVDVLIKLAEDKFWGVRATIVRHPKVSVNMLIRFFEYEKNLKKPRDMVIKLLYANPKLPHVARIIIETLFGDIL